MQSPTLSKLGINVLLLDPVPMQTLKGFTALGWNIESDFTPMTEAQLQRKIRDFQVVCLARDSTEPILTDEIIRSAHRLLAIGFFGRFVIIRSTNLLFFVFDSFTHQL